MKSKRTKTTSQTWMPYPKPVASRGGCKVDWNYYADEATALECAKAAWNNKQIMEREGYHWGYCCPGSVTLLPANGCVSEYAGLWEVCLP
jgi:hypothetical protein